MFKLKCLLSAATLLSLSLPAFAAHAPSTPGTVVEIPTPDGTYISWENVTVTGGGNVEDRGHSFELGSTRNGTSATFNIRNTVEQPYILNFATGSSGCEGNIVITLSKGSETLYTWNHAIEDTGGWTNFNSVSQFDLMSLPTGDYTLNFKASVTKGNYAGNWTNLAFIANPPQGSVITLPLANWTIDNGFRHENADKSDGGNFGYATKGAKAHVGFTIAEAGVYNWAWNINWKQNPGTFRVTVTNAAGQVEATKDWRWENGDLGVYTFTLPAPLSAGAKTATVEVIDGDGFICNFQMPTLTRVGSTYASLSSITVDGAENLPLDGFDYNFVLPRAYEGQNVVLDVAYANAALSATLDGAPLAVEGQKVTVPTPLPGAQALLALKLTPDDGAYAEKVEYAVRLFHVGETRVESLKLGWTPLDQAVAEVLNSGADHAYTIADKVYTSVPALEVVFADGSKTTANGTLEGTTAVYSFAGGEGDLRRAFTLTLSDVHVYDQTEGDQFKSVRWNADNGAFSVDGVGDGWSGTQMKFRTNTDYTLNVPGDAVVKKVTFGGLRDNYQPGHIAKFTGSASAIYLPEDRDFITGTDREVAVVVEGHQAGTPFVFSFDAGSQPVAWFDVVYGEAVPEADPVALSVSNTQTETANHAVVSVRFDREVSAPAKTVIVKLNGEETEVTPAVDGGSILLPLWNLAWATDYTMVIPAGTLKDKYGMGNVEVTHAFTVGAEPAVATVDADHFIEVTNVDELKAAVAKVNAQNNKADAPTTVIYIHNGDYNVGSEKISGHHLHINKAYNVTLVGESRDGVLIHGVNDGISNGVVSSRYSTNIQFENLTIRNDLDYNAVVSGGSRVGVGCAFYGGNRDVMKNVTLQSVQDTYVTGERGYHVGCRIEGSVDYICGGGDHFFDGCELVNVLAGPIVAPATSAVNHWGYVFQNCTISGKAGYNLGRPWQNEPRAYYLNTTMEALPTDAGWAGMGNLPTHFYEYNSMDKDGKALDLSKRKNSPTHTGDAYVPVLSAEDASLFTVYNVLGGKDSWLAVGDTETLPAVETLSLSKDNVLSWSAVPGASYYLVFADGAMVGRAETNSFDIVATRAAGETQYTVAAAKANGSLGTVSGAVSVSNPVLSGLSSVVAGSEAVTTELYNLQGIRVSDDYRGAVVRVSVFADGGRRVEKLFRK